MNIKELSTIKEVANYTRLVCKNLQKEKILHAEPDLSCACAIASALLFHNLKRSGIEATIGYNICHCWVEVGHLIVDITATQFGKKYPPVYLAGRSIGGRWHSTSKFSDIRAFKEHLRAEAWPEEQIPHMTRLVQLQNKYGDLS
jgi:hypothetical protein